MFLPVSYLFIFVTSFFPTLRNVTCIIHNIFTYLLSPRMQIKYCFRIASMYSAKSSEMGTTNWVKYWFRVIFIVSLTSLNAVVNWSRFIIVWLNLLYCSLRKLLIFCVVILYPASLLNSFIVWFSFIFQSPFVLFWKINHIICKQIILLPLFQYLWL